MPQPKPMAQAQPKPAAKPMARPAGKPMAKPASKPKHGAKPELNAAVKKSGVRPATPL